MTDFAYEIEESGRPSLGLIVLSVDETVEHDFRLLFRPEDVTLHVTRIASGDDLTTQTIAKMEPRLTDAARLLPSAPRFDAVGYACTSASAQIGASRVHAAILAGVSAEHVTDPLTATFAAAESLGIRRIGLVSPYIEDVSARLRKALTEGGLDVVETLSFGERTEARVARIAPRSIAEAARTIAARQTLDGIFLSCTNLRTLDFLAALEDELSLPILSSNQALAWHLARLSGAPLIGPSAGRLMVL